jgi:hypothetical protein
MKARVGDWVKYLIAGVLVNTGIVEKVLDNEHLLIRNTNGRKDIVALWQISDVVDKSVLDREAYARAMRGI